jgi:ATP-dependent Clp protease adaptor protein ClpS
VDAVVFALVAAGMGALWWRHLRVHHEVTRPRALGTAFDGDAEVALHVASHEARSRGEPMTSLHVLYGLLQDETIAEAVRVTGGDPSALEDKVLAAIDDKPTPTEDDVHRVYGFAAGHASHNGRRATATDLWAYLRGSDAALVIDVATLGKVLFQLCHGSEPEARIDGNHDVHVVLRNDDYTTQQFVCHVLEEVFALSEAEATTRMMQTHERGRAIVGRFRPDEARAKIEDVRSRARAGGFPLWIGIEPI